MSFRNIRIFTFPHYYCLQIFENVWIVVLVAQKTRRFLIFRKIWFLHFAILKKFLQIQNTTYPDQKFVKTKLGTRLKTNLWSKSYALFICQSEIEIWIRNFNFSSKFRQVPEKKKHMEISISDPNFDSWSKFQPAEKKFCFWYFEKLYFWILQF